MPSYVAISSEKHRDKHWTRRSSLSFAKADNVAPLYLSELAKAAQAMPIAFVKHESRFLLIVVMGLRPSENLFISEDGTWHSDYMPVNYRSSPFAMISTPGNEAEQIFCIDDECVTDGPEGLPFFTEDGAVAEELRQAFETVQVFNSTKQLTQTAIDSLESFGLIKPWELVLDNGEEKQSVEGLYIIDEAAFNALPDEQFLQLRKVGAIPVVFSQMLSMQKIGSLAQLLRARQVQAEKPSESETFNFAGL